MIEIERKFLVKSHFPTDPQAERLVQGYLSTEADRTVRIRLGHTCGYITVKGKGSESGMSRFEWETAILRGEAERLLVLCTDVVSKVRHSIDLGDYTWEIDVFEGDNAGLVVAEIELKSEEDIFFLPDWIGEEVTGEPRYYNSMLGKNPYCNWS